MSAPSPGQLAMQHAAAAEAAEAPLPHSRLATSMGLGTAAAVTAGGGAAKGAGPTTTFTERRVKNTAQVRGRVCEVKTSTGHKRAQRC